MKPNYMVSLLFFGIGCASSVTSSDGGVPPMEGGPPLTDGNVVPVHLPVHVVVGPWLPLRPGAAFAVRVDASNGTTVEATTDDTGRADIVLDPAGAPWTLSVAKDWYTVLSIVGIDSTTVLGDLYVAPVQNMIPLPTDHVEHRFSGAVTYPPTPGQQVWMSSEYYPSTSVHEGLDGSFDTTILSFPNAPPMQVSFVQWDPVSFRAFNAALFSIPRTGADVVFTSAMPEPPDEQRRVVHVALPTAGLMTADTFNYHATVYGLLRGNVDHLGVLATGGGETTRNGSGVDVSVQIFGSFVPDVVAVSFLAGLECYLLVPLNGSPLTLGELRGLTLTGTTLQDVTASWDATGYDTVALYLRDNQHLYEHRVYGITRGTSGTLRAPALPYAYQPPSATTELTVESHLSLAGQHPWFPPDTAPFESTVGHRATTVHR